MSLVAIQHAQDDVVVEDWLHTICSYRIRAVHHYHHHHHEKRRPIVQPICVTLCFYGVLLYASSSSLLHDLHIICFLQVMFSCSSLPSLTASSAETYLPLVHLILRLFVLFHQVVQYLLQSICICLKLRHDIVDCLFDQDSINHSKTLAIGRERCECFEYQSEFGSGC